MATMNEGEVRSRNDALNSGTGGVTARARMDADLFRAKEILRAALATIEDAVVVTDASGNVTFMNPVAESLTGWSESEGRGRPLHDVFQILEETARQPASNPSATALVEARSVRVANHTVLVSRTGAEIPIDESATPLLDEEGRVAGSVLVFRSVGARRRAEEALQTSERELSEFFEHASVGMHWVGPDGIVLRVNRAELHMLGYSREEYLGHHISEFHVDKHVIDDMLWRLRAGDELREVEARMWCKDGTIKHVVIDSNVHWENDNFIHTRCFVRDITDRTQIEEARARLAAIVESSQDAIIAKSLTGEILSWNAGAERLLGYRADEIVGKPVMLLVPADHQEEEAGIMSRLARGERIDELETLRVAKDGRHIEVSLSISPIRGHAGHLIGASSIARDISARRRAEQTNAELLAALKEADRRKDEFLAMLAHELRNPLAPIRNAVHILRAKSPPVPDLQWAREVIDRQAAQMSRLVDDLLDVSRITRGKIELRRERIELATVVRSAVEASRPLIEKWGHELTVNLPTDPVLLDADLTRLSQVLLNLLNNAAKYTEQGGKIVLNAAEDGAQVVIRVRDNGMGIPRDQIASVFEMFTQLDRSLDRSHGGLGIGLTLVRQLVLMHGGSVEAHSEGPGTGSEFVVRLPAWRAQSQSGQNAVGEHQPTLPRCRILVVDDNEDAADSLGMVLRMMGSEVLTANDGLEAVGAAAVFQPQVILMDLGLPKLSGYEAARRIRNEQGASVLLIAVTGWGQDDDRRRSEVAGFDYHLTKPVAFEKLQKLLAGRVPGFAETPSR